MCFGTKPISCRGAPAFDESGDAFGCAGMAWHAARNVRGVGHGPERGDVQGEKGQRPVWGGSGKWVGLRRSALVDVEVVVAMPMTPRDVRGGGTRVDTRPWEGPKGKPCPAFASVFGRGSMATDYRSDTRYADPWQ